MGGIVPVLVIAAVIISISVAMYMYIIYAPNFIEINEGEAVMVGPIRYTILFDGVGCISQEEDYPQDVLKDCTYSADISHWDTSEEDTDGGDASPWQAIKDNVSKTPEDSGTDGEDNWFFDWFFGFFSASDETGTDGKDAAPRDVFVKIRIDAENTGTAPLTISGWQFRILNENDQSEKPVYGDFSEEDLLRTVLEPEEQVSQTTQFYMPYDKDAKYHVLIKAMREHNTMDVGRVCITNC